MSLTVDGEQKAINADFRDIIQILIAFGDKELTDEEKTIVMLNNLYVNDFREFINLSEAVEQANWFIDWGKSKNVSEKMPKRVMDWEQDYNLIVSAVNQKIQNEIRAMDFLHWWTFLGYFSERGECQYSQVLTIREKLAKHQKLEKWERDLLKSNQDMILLSDDKDDELEAELWG